jgi:signal transduction histidine kinase
MTSIQIIIIAILALICAVLIIFAILKNKELNNITAQLKTIETRAKHGGRLHIGGGGPAVARLTEEINTFTQKSLEAAEAGKQAEESVKLSTAAIAHDIRTPVTAMAGYAQLLKTEEDPAKIKEYAQKIQSAAAQLTQTAENFYELSVIDKAVGIDRMEKTDLAAEVSSCFMEFYESFEQRGLGIEFQTPEEHIYVMADRQRLLRILHNVIQNLLRYAKSSVVITFANPQGEGSVTIENDTDYPIPENPAQVFEKFWSADPSRSTGNAGIGMHISRRIAENMGGKLTADADIKEKIFRLTLTLSEGYGYEKESAS